MSLLCYITRHGETEWNVKKIHQGHLDSPLTEKGKEDAREKGGLLQKRGIKIIYSSDLGRCMQTANIINEFLHLKIVFVKQLRERNFGVLDGKHRSEIYDKLGDIWDMNSPAPPKGESLKQLKERILGFVRSLEGKEEYPVLVITHGGPTRIILSEILHKTPSDPECKPEQHYVGKFEIENDELQNFEYIRQ